MKNICILSHLKPIDDTRHFHKLAQSLAKTNKYEINIIGFGLKKIIETPNIHFHFVATSSFSMIHRIVFPWKLLMKCIELKPDLILVNHPEILPFALSYKILFGGKIIYDIQENYKLNLLHQQHYTFPVQQFAGYMIRAIESICAKKIDHFFLAERIYVEQLTFINSRWTVLENKALLKSEGASKPKNKPPKQLLFSGNISRNSGADIALSFYSKLVEEYPELRLEVIGHAPNKCTLKSLKKTYAQSANIVLNIHTKPVPYEEILAAITRADMAIISYRENQSNKGKVPTKYFEYNAANLPYVIDQESSWTNLPSKLQIQVDFKHPNWQKILTQWRSLPHLHAEEVADYTWENQVDTLIVAIEKVLSA